jgi:hypothetical protein
VEQALRRTLADAVAMLGGRGIPAAVIGGLAVSLRGQPRMTVDVDLIVLADVEQAVGLVRDLLETPFEPLFPGVEEVVSRSFILPLRHRSTGVRVDLALGMSGFEQEAVARATAIDLGGTPVPVVAAVDLLVMKALAGRPRDEEDMRSIIATQGESLDWDACLDLARQLGAAIDVDIASRLEAVRR